MSPSLKIVVMGVSGCGKSTVGAALANALGGHYDDGDDLHPTANIVKMSAGIPLDDNDRWPWLDAVGQRLAAGSSASVIGCSALKRVYRDRIRAAVGQDVVFVHLAGSFAQITARLESRPNHFMPASLLASQFAALEAPGEDETAVTIGIDRPVPEAIRQILAFLQSSEARPAGRAAP